MRLKLGYLFYHLIPFLLLLQVQVLFGSFPAKFRAAHITVARIDFQYGDTVSEGKVCTQIPLATSYVRDLLSN